MVGCVAGGPGALEAADPLAVLYHMESLRGNRDDVADEALEAVPEDAARASQQARGVRQVRRAHWMDVDLELRPALQQRTGRAGVVEVDVRQQQPARRASCESLEQLLEAGARTAIDQDVSADPRAEDARPPVVAQVDDLGLLSRHGLLALALESAASRAASRAAPMGIRTIAPFCQ